MLRAQQALLDLVLYNSLHAKRLLLWRHRFVLWLLLVGHVSRLAWFAHLEFLLLLVQYLNTVEADASSLLEAINDVVAVGVCAAVRFLGLMMARVHRAGRLALQMCMPAAVRVAPILRVLLGGLLVVELGRELRGSRSSH